MILPDKRAYFDDDVSDSTLQNNVLRLLVQPGSLVRWARSDRQKLSQYNRRVQWGICSGVFSNHCKVFWSDGKFAMHKLHELDIESVGFYIKVEAK